MQFCKDVMMKNKQLDDHALRFQKAHDVEQVRSGVSRNSLNIAHVLSLILSIKISRLSAITVIQNLEAFVADSIDQNIDTVVHSMDQNIETVIGSIHQNLERVDYYNDSNVETVAHFSGFKDKTIGLAWV